MDTSKTATPATEYFSARSRTASLESSSSTTMISLAPIDDDGKSNIGVSNSAKRDFKDKRIYVNPRTGLPIRPPSSFGLYMHAMRRSLEGSKVSFSDFHKKATTSWAKMSDEDKEPYFERAKKLSEQYKKIEVFYLRKRVRDLENKLKEQRRANSGSSSSSHNSNRRRLDY